MRPLREPGRFRIRQARLDEFPVLAEVTLRSCREASGQAAATMAGHERHVMSEVERWRAAAHAGGYFWVVVDHATAPGSAGTGVPGVVGFSHACAARDPGAPASLELALMSLLPVAHGSGIADRLLQMTIGDAPAYVWVLDDQVRAQHFYRRHGFVLDGAARGDAWREVRMTRA